MRVDVANPTDKLLYSMLGVAVDGQSRHVTVH